jgi:hypothetical protein
MYEKDFKEMSRKNVILRIKEIVFINLLFRNEHRIIIFINFRKRHILCDERFLLIDVTKPMVTLRSCTSKKCQKKRLACF